MRVCQKMYTHVKKARVAKRCVHILRDFYTFSMYYFLN